MAYSKLVNLLDAMSRPETDEYFLLMAKLTSTRATCVRRRVGCILVNSQNHVIATGYNGVAKGSTHCIEVKCPGADQPSGQGLHLCQAIHAEQNALMQCRNINDIYVAYVTASPCISCTRMLLGTSCRMIKFIDEYPHYEAKDLWQASGRIWVQIKYPFDVLQVVK